MKKITCLFFLFSLCGFAQVKSTGEVELSGDMKAALELNNATLTAKLTLVGPNDRWFSLQFGSFATEEGMAFGEDVVYWNNVTLVDAVQQGIAQVPEPDVADWVFVSNDDNVPSEGLRTIVFTRAFATGDAGDYVFNFGDTTIDFAWARRSNASYTLGNHGGNRGYVFDVPLATLGVEDFSLNAATVYPNPSKGNFIVKSRTALDRVAIYSQTGAFIKVVDVGVGGMQIEVSTEGLSQGVYLVELQNASEKSWKKIVVN